ncbi:MAG: hypothetical protein WD648_15460 [Planctomycetaceae bacterium]
MHAIEPRLLHDPGAIAEKRAKPLTVPRLPFRTLETRPPQLSTQCTRSQLAASQQNCAAYSSTMASRRTASDARSAWNGFYSFFSFPNSAWERIFAKLDSTDFGELPSGLSRSAELAAGLRVEDSRAELAEVRFASPCHSMRSFETVGSQAELGNQKVPYETARAVFELLFGCGGRFDGRRETTERGHDRL